MVDLNSTDDELDVDHMLKNIENQEDNSLKNIVYALEELKLDFDSINCIQQENNNSDNEYNNDKIDIVLLELSEIKEYLSEMNNNISLLVDKLTQL